MLLVQPKEDAAEQFSKERIEPMVRATPVLRGLVGSSKTRNAKETLLYIVSRKAAETPISAADTRG